MPTEEEAASSSAPLGKRLRTARLSSGMTQSDLAQGQFSVSYVSAVERGQLRPSLRALEKLARRLDVSVTDLLRDDEDAPSPAAAHAHGSVGGPRDEWEQQLYGLQALIRQGKATDAVDTIIRLRAHMSPLAPGERAYWHWQFAAAYLALGRADDALNELREAVPLAEQAGDVDLRRWLDFGSGKAYQIKQEWPRALEVYQECLAALDANAPNDPAIRLNVLIGLGEICWQLGENDSTGEYLCQATLAGETLLDPARLGEVYWAASTAYSAQGDAQRAREFAIRSAAAYGTSDLQRQMVRAYSRLGRVNLQAHRLDMAASHLEHAAELGERWHDCSGRVDALCGLVVVYLESQREGDAAAALEQARAGCEHFDSPTLEAEIVLADARLLEAQHEVEASRQNFVRGLSLLEEAAAPQRLSQAYKDYSDFAERQGDSTQAFELLKKAWQLRPSV